MHVSAAILLVASVLRFYDSRYGFTALLGFGEKPAASVVPALKNVPFYVQRGSTGYDGQYYVQMAVDPLLRDPATDRAMDDAPLRARRILLSWTAYALGLGRPAWILQAFALQNVLCWLALASVLRRWFALTTGRGIALWLATLFAAGLMWSVRFSLLDGPSLLALALSVAAIERGSPWTAAILCGAAGLIRETNVLGVAALVDPTRWRVGSRPEGLRYTHAVLMDTRAVLKQFALIVTALLPLAIWFDYIHSIYRSLIFTSGETMARPLAGLSWRAQVAMEQMARGAIWADALTVAMIAAFAAQVGWIVARPRWQDPWWRIGAAYAILLPFLGQPLWTGTPAAVVRIELPLLLAFNVGIQRVERPMVFWLLFACGNAAAFQSLLIGMP